ncbi:hypothetical protein N8861_05430, partial [Porticoccus sp.]|nr:hypothetical protein [Porticoccus sp.]
MKLKFIALIFITVLATGCAAENQASLFSHHPKTVNLKLDQIMSIHTNVYPYKHLARLVEGVF